MRIVILSPRIQGTSGNGKLALEMATGLIKEGHQVFSIGTNYNDIPTEKSNKGITVPILPSFFNLSLRRGENIPKIAKYLSVLGAELLIAVGDPYYMSEDCFGNLNIPKGKCEYVAYVTVDSEGEFCRVQQEKDGKRNILKVVDKIISTSKYGEKELKEWGYQVHQTIPEFVDTELFKTVSKEKKSELRKRYGLKDDEIVLLHIGRPTARKRQEIMFEGIAKYALENKKIKLLTLIPKISGLGDVYNMEDYVGRVLKKKFNHDFVENENMLMIKGTNLEDGLAIEQIRDLYNIADIYVSSAGGEGWGLCCEPNTKIYTDTGIKNIKDIDVGEKVFSHTGKLRKVTELMNRDVKEDLIVIKPSHYREELKLTKEHPVLVAGKNYSINWKKAGLLKKGDILAIPFPKIKYYDKKYLNCLDYLDDLVCFKNKVYNYEPFFNNKTKRKSLVIHPNSKGFLKLLKMEDFLKIAGYYLSEGSINNGRVTFSLNASKDEEIKKDLKSISKKWNLHLGEEYMDRNRCNFSISSTILGKLLNKLFKKGSHNKIIPFEFLNLDNKKIKLLLKSLWLGDGCIWKDKNKKSFECSYTTVSEKMFYAIKLLLNKIGIVPSTQYHKQRKSYSIKFFSKSNDYNKIFDVENYKTTVKIIDNKYFLKIKDVKKEKYKGKVYNFEVEKEHSYLTSTAAIHNCIPEAMHSGVPCIIPNNTTGPELLGMNQITPTNMPFILCEGGILLNTPHKLNIGFGLVQYHTDENIFYEGVKYLVENPNVLQNLKKSCVDRAKLYSLDVFNDNWKYFVKSLEDKKVDKIEKDKSKVD